MAGGGSRVTAPLLVAATRAAAKLSTLHRCRLVDFCQQKIPSADAVAVVYFYHTDHSQPATCAEERKPSFYAGAFERLPFIETTAAPENPLLSAFWPLELGGGLTALRCTMPPVCQQNYRFQETCGNIMPLASPGGGAGRRLGPPQLRQNHYNQTTTR